MADVKMARTENNVLCSLLGNSSDVRKVFLTTFLLFLFLGFHSAEECDFVRCITGVRSYIFDLSLKKASFNCKNVSDIPFCSKNCMQRYFPNAFSNSKDKLSFTSYCDQNISNRLHSNWSCIARHNYRLFTCLANVNSLTTNDVREDIMLTESCRKYIEFQNCPKQVLLADCGQESSNVVKDLILFILDNYQPVSCKGANVKDVLSMPIHYQLGSDFVEAAKSLDEHRNEVRNCLTQPMQDEADLDEFLCGEYNPAISNCVNYALTENGGKSYPDVNRLLLKIIALSGFKCKQSSFDPKAVSTSPSSESENMKSDAYPSLKDVTITNSHEMSTSKNVEIYSNHDSKLTPESSTYAKTEAQEKSESPMKDSPDVKKIKKIINVNDSDNRNSKKHTNQNVHSANMCSRINISVFTFSFCLIFLFIFR